MKYLNETIWTRMESNLYRRTYNLFEHFSYPFTYHQLVDLKEDVSRRIRRIRMMTVNQLRNDFKS